MASKTAPPAESTTKPKYKAFPAVVCQQIRNLQDYISECDRARSKAFDTRDHLKNQIAKCDGPEVEHLKAKRNDAIDKIEVLAEAIGWARKELKESIDKADEPGLFESADLNIPDFEQRILEKARSKDKTEGGEGEAEDPNQLELGDDSIENYLPGQWRAKDGRIMDIGDLAVIQEYAVIRVADAGVGDPDLEPVFSPTWGCRVDIVHKGKVLDSLSYVGPIPESPAKGKRGKKG